MTNKRRMASTVFPAELCPDSAKSKDFWIAIMSKMPQHLRLRLPVPSAAVFLIAAAVASDAVPSLGPSIHAVEWIGTIALVVILFDGGSSIGLRRFRTVALPV